MPPAIAAAAITTAGTAYAANRASKATSSAAQMASDAASRPMFTGRSSMNRNPITGGTEIGTQGLITIDPTIRALRERALGRLPDYRTGITNASADLNTGLSQARDAYGGIYDDLTSNENPFIQARVNPLMARAAEGRGALGRSLTRRGLGGSSLYSTGLGNYDAQVGREIGDQRSLATAESLNARRGALQDITGLDTQRYNAALSAVQAFQSLDASEQSIAGQNLAQELSALGLSQAETAGLMQAAGMQMQAAQLKNETYGRAFDTIGRSLSGLNFGSSPMEKYSAANPGAVI